MAWAYSNERDHEKAARRRAEEAQRDKAGRELDRKIRENELAIARTEARIEAIRERALVDEVLREAVRVTERTAKLKTLAAQSDKARRLQTMPGVGPLTAFAVEALGPDMAQFKTGRGFAAWLGLVPKQHSSGGKERSGRMAVYCR